MKLASIIVALSAIVPSRAWGQDVAIASPPDAPPPLLFPDPTLRAETLVQERVGHMSFSLAVFGRLSIPGGGTVDDAGLVYSDLFDTGGGAGLEGDLTMGVGGHLELGGYASINYDVFGGTSAVDDLGNEIDPNDMRVTTAFVGGKARGYFSPWFFWEGRIGVGVVHYDSVSAVITNAGGPPVKDDLFRATTHGAFEIAGLVGWGSPRIAGELGFGYRLMGAPQRGKNISDLIDPDPFDTVFLELGLRIRF